MIHSLFTNMAYIISITFIIVKLKDLFLKGKGRKIYPFLKPHTIGLFSVIIMQQQIMINDMLFDLRAVPLLWYSQLRGWKIGLLACMIPLFYRLSMGGPTVYIGTFATILLPVIIGAILFESETDDQEFKTLNLKKVLISSTVYFLLNALLGFLTLKIEVSDWVVISIFTTISGTLSILAITFMVNDDSKETNQKRQLIELSSYDDKTKLLNFRTFHEQLTNKVNQNIPGYVLMIDIDHFKKYNDTYGHYAGDEAIFKLSDILRESMSNEDLAGRFGGEEFMLFIQTNSKRDVREFIDRVRSGLYDPLNKLSEGQITISVGISEHSRNTNVNELLFQADRALYQSKENGRNRFTFYHDGENSEI
jgi:diguanylate cyclase